MRMLNKSVLILSITAAFSASAAIQVADTNETSFQIGGEILPECKVSSTALSGATSLDLGSTSAQDAASVSIWCNTGQENATTTYESTNAGFLVNAEGKKIAYKIDVAGEQTDIALTSATTIQQSTGTGVDASDETRTISIKPEVTGFEFSGTYSDTIEVTVTFN